jgi:hypothetical protein
MQGKVKRKEAGISRNIPAFISFLLITCMSLQRFKPLFADFTSFFLVNVSKRKDLPASLTLSDKAGKRKRSHRQAVKRYQ